MSSLAERPDFTAIAAHQRLMNYYGGGLSVEYLDQVVDYALNLEQALMEIREGRCDDPQPRAAEALWPPPINRRGSLRCLPRRSCLVPAAIARGGLEIK